VRLCRDILRFRREKSPLLVAQEVIERDVPLLCHQYPLPYLGIDDELLLAVVEVERLVENPRASLVLSLVPARKAGCCLPE
jgi:hypothetical protein